MCPVPRHAHEALLRGYLDELARTHPRLRVVKKGDSRLNRLIDKVLKIITFGGQASYLNGFVTTLGQRIYVPDDWDTWPAGQRYCILRHELVHVRQFRRWTWPGMVLLYLVVPLPVLFSGRAAVEVPAYRESLTATWQVYGPDAAKDPREVDRIVARFTGPDYAWMWVAGGTIRRAMEHHLERLDASPPPPLGV